MNPESPSASGIVSRARAVLVAAAVVLMATTGASSSRAETTARGQILVPENGARVPAGEVVTVRWESLPAGVEEFELLLLLDESSDRTLRLTEMMEPGLTSFTWLVPDLPAANARLQIRYRLGGREVEAAAGAGFEIVGDAGSVSVKPVFRDGEWWLTTGSGLWPTEVTPRSEGLEAPSPLPWAGREAAEGGSGGASFVGGSGGYFARLAGRGTTRTAVSVAQGDGGAFVSRPQRE